MTYTESEEKLLRNAQKMEKSASGEIRMWIVSFLVVTVMILRALRNPESWDSWLVVILFAGCCALAIMNVRIRERGLRLIAKLHREAIETRS